MASLIKRGKTFQAQFYAGGRRRRRSLRTTSLQVAKQKLRQLESAIARGDDNPLPSRTPVADVVTRYVEHIRAVKTPKSAQTDIYYLREAFGPICRFGTSSAAPHRNGHAYVTAQPAAARFVTAGGQ